MINFDEIRKQFPMLKDKKMQGKKLVFMDNASTTFKPYAVIEAMDEYYLNETSNTHRGDYDLCYNADVRVSEARKTIANFINSEENEVVFTSGDTEAINLVAYGFGLKFLTKDDAILISEAEHASNALPWFKISKLTGCNIRFVNSVDGRITSESINECFHKYKNIKFVAIAQVGNVLGYLNDVKTIAQIAHKNGALILVDGAQSVPHMKVDFKDLDIDFLAFSAHKMCGPTGIGALIGKYDILKSMDTFNSGGGMNITFDSDVTVQESLPPTKFEAGTLNIAGIYGFKAAVDFLMSIGMENIEKREAELKRYMLNKLKEIKDLIIYNENADASIVTFNKKGVFAQDEATLLNFNGIAVRSGEHCAKMIHHIIHEKATVRASLYFYTSFEEIDIFVDKVANGGDILDAYFK